MFAEGTNHLFQYIFEINDIGLQHTRTVWNFEKALGLVGGLIYLFTTILKMLCSPCFRNRLAHRLAKTTQIGKEAELNGKCFRLQHYVCYYFICWNCSKGSGRFKKQCDTFDEIQGVIRQKLHVEFLDENEGANEA